MGKRILISENEKEQIRSLHENQKKEINYFQILENKVNRLLVTEQHQPPNVTPGTFISPDGTKLVRNETSKVKPLIIKAETKFAPGKSEPWSLTENEKKQINEWYKNSLLKNVETEVIVTAGSSKSGPGATEEERKKFNIELAQKRANTAFSSIKVFLGTVPGVTLDKVKYITDISQAFSGPDYIPGTNKSSEPQYQPYQFVTITIQAKAEISVQKSETYTFQPYRILGWNAPHTRIITFCADGFATDAQGVYRCKVQKPNYASVYYSNGGDNQEPGKVRWIPVEEGDVAGQSVSNSNFVLGLGMWDEKKYPNARWCFQYEYNGASNEPKCQDYFKKWPNYSNRYRYGGQGSNWSVPGNEVPKATAEKIAKNWSTYKTSGQ
jgi:hypothetical protein